MSKYIQVLKRLEGEKVVPRPVPAADPNRDRRVATRDETPARIDPPAIADPESAPTAVSPRAAYPVEPSQPPRRAPAPPPAPQPGVPVIPAPVAPVARAPVPTTPTPVAPLPVAPAAAPAPTPVARVEPARPPAPAPIAPPAPAPEHPPRLRPIAPGDLRGISRLYDNIRTIVTGRPSRILVFAGASPAEPTARLTSGLARYAERHGSRPFVVDMMRREGRPLLMPRDGGTPREIDLDGGAVPAELQAWLQEVAPTADLVILEAPPLSTSVDAALLACASDGLMIVAERDVTPRAALLAAADRARVTGCRTLGVVMTGTPEPLPGWMRQLMHAAGHTSPEET